MSMGNKGSSSWAIVQYSHALCCYRPEPLERGISSSLSFGMDEEIPADKLSPVKSFTHPFTEWDGKGWFLIFFHPSDVAYFCDDIAAKIRTPINIYSD